MNSIKEQIRQEIERQIRSVNEKQDANPAMPKYRWHMYEGMKEAFIDMNYFLDSLPEEKPSEELEKAAEKQINEALFKWSYDDEDGIEQYVHDAFIAGWDGCKEQMMKDAVEGKLVDLGFGYRIDLDSELLDTFNIKYGQKFKVIVIKED